MDHSLPRLLIIDDDPTILTFIGEALSNEYKVLFATSADDGLELAMQIPHPDLILLDIQLPNCNGHQLCRLLKERFETQNIPVIFITGENTTAQQVESFAVGGCDFISKPITVEVLRARVKIHITLHQQRKALEQLAHTDHLTKVPNRRAFDEALKAAWERNLKSQQALAVLMIDIDDFKKYNDFYGHEYGDDCLQRVASVLQGAKTNEDQCVGRIGGEEFAVLVPSGGEQVAQELGLDILKRLEAEAIEHKKATHFSQVTLSIGLASMIPQINQRPSDLMSDADKAMYYAKAHGKNTIISADASG